MANIAQLLGKRTDQYIIQMNNPEETQPNFLNVWNNNNYVKEESNQAARKPLMQS